MTDAPEPIQEVNRLIKHYKEEIEIADEYHREDKRRMKLLIHHLEERKKDLERRSRPVLTSVKLLDGDKDK